MKKILCSIIRLFYHAMYCIDVRGLENIPKKGKVIFASNHLSNNDPPLILSYIAKVRDDFNVIAKKELFRNPIIGYFLEKLGAIKIDRQNLNISSIKKAIDVLRKEQCLLVFPEGTRKRHAIDVNPKTGVIYLSKKTESDIIPVKISYFKNASKLGKIIIVFGNIISFHKDIANLNSRKMLEDLMEKIYSL